MIKKRVATAVALGLSICMASMTVFATPSVSQLQTQKEQVQAKKDALQEKLQEIYVEQGKIEDQLVKTQKKLDKTKVDINKAQKEVDKQYDAMKDRIKFMYENGDDSIFATLFSAESFTDFVNKAEYVSSIHKYDRDMFDDYKKNKEKLDNLYVKQQKEQNELEEKDAEFQQKGAETSTLIQETANEIAKINQDLSKAKAEEARRKAALEAAAAAAAASQEASYAVTGNVDSGSPVKVPENASAAVAKILSAANSQLGVPYVWGGTTPGVGLDCSGLVQYCYAQAGISLPRVSEAQGSTGYGGRLTGNPQPGDLVCYGHHIGIYVGGGNMIHAPHTGDVVRNAPVYGSPWYITYLY
jgi:cell wall-associated NlpC family hydrolase